MLPAARPSTGLRNAAHPPSPMGRYEIEDRSLDDIRHVAQPTFTPKELGLVDSSTAWSRSLDGTRRLSCLA
jgi:hypothetical protein